MALPAVMSLLGKAAASTAVQSAAQKLLVDVYGRVMAQRGPDAPAMAFDPGVLATREEVAASFALLQAELDARFARMARLVVAVGIIQALVLGALVILT